MPNHGIGASVLSRLLSPAGGKDWDILSCGVNCF